MVTIVTSPPSEAQIKQQEWLKAASDLRQRIIKATPAMLELHSGSEVRGFATAADLLISFGYSCEQTACITVLKIYDDGTEARSTAFGTAAAVRACVRLFIEGDEGNQHLYALADPLQSANRDLRCIP